MAKNARTTRVFISHAVADKKLVDALVDLLQVGCNLTVQQIFASSIEGVGIPPGRPFVEYMKAQLAEAALVIEVVTPSYWASPFCVCELGGQWALGLDAFPLIVPPQNFADLKAVLHISQAAMIDRAEDLDDLRDRVKERLDSNVSTSRWNAKRDTFLKILLPKLLNQLAGPQQVPAKRVAEMEEHLRELEVMLAEKSDTLEALQSRFDALAVAKTREEAIELARPDDEFEEMDLLQTAVLNAFRDIPPVVRETIFEEVTERGAGTGWIPDGDDRKAADEQVREGLLKWHRHGDGLIPNEEEPAVMRAVEAARKLCSWETSGEFDEAFKQEHDVAWAPKTRRLWSELNLL
jgi:hypothetical protein